MQQISSLACLHTHTHIYTHTYTHTHTHTPANAHTHKNLQADPDVRRKTLPKVAAAPTVGHLLNELFEAMCEE